MSINYKYNIRIIFVQISQWNIPSHRFPVFCCWYPLLQLHSKDPSVLVQSWSQGLNWSHSLISTLKHEIITTVFHTTRQSYLCRCFHLVLVLQGRSIDLVPQQQHRCESKNWHHRKFSLKAKNTANSTVLMHGPKEILEPHYIMQGCSHCNANGTSLRYKNYDCMSFHQHQERILLHMYTQMTLVC